MTKTSARVISLAVLVLVATAACASKPVEEAAPPSVTEAIDTPASIPAPVADETECSIATLTAAAGSKWPKDAYGDAANSSQGFCDGGWAAVPYISPETGDPIIELFEWTGEGWEHKGRVYGTCDSVMDTGVPKDVTHTIVPKEFCNFG